MDNFKKGQFLQIVRTFHGYLMHVEGTVIRDSYTLYLETCSLVLESFNKSCLLSFERLRPDLGPALTPYSVGSGSFFPEVKAGKA
jgi:hypothetical protein